MLISQVNISKYDNKRYVLNTVGGRNILVNENVVKLVDILTSNTEIGTACSCFNDANGFSLTVDEFFSVLQERLGGYGILVDDHTNVRALPDTYLKLKVELINSRVAGFLSQIFLPFFSPIIFYLLLGLMSIVSLFILNFILSTTFQNLTINYTLLTITICTVMLIHELGHIAACRKFKIKHGGIGFGIYLVFPVAYADITNVWQASKSQRIMANLGGVFNEYLYAFTLLGVYWISQNETFLLAYFIITSKVLFELNPFVRLDGYWVLSDLTGTPNLLPRARKAITESLNIKGFFNFIKNPTIGLSSRGLLIGYGLANYLIVIIYLLLIWFNYQHHITNFPLNLKNLVSKLIGLNLELKDLKGAYLMVILFYYLAIKYSYNFIINPLYKKISNRLRH
ncbi:zinc metalloprotease [Pedobacter jejuensis]|uniref:Peptidase M50 n=1 Tax=Pedobacter jejuensis TaxID=1268550 RepID=A0A3N0BUV6_9SPHI|nr:hypothetical protein [Pedobacter jejuensis]RNL52505.1 hypothetical protein D7004_13225 [Pedobacter jejuensis]